MDVRKVLEDLRAYRTQLDQAIAVFDRLAGNRGKLGGPVKKKSARRPLRQRVRKSTLTARRKRRAAARTKMPKS